MLIWIFISVIQRNHSYQYEQYNSDKIIGVCILQVSAVWDLLIFFSSVVAKSTTMYGKFLHDFVYRKLSVWQHHYVFWMSYSKINRVLLFKTECS